jgi:ankyrin repeat protein
LSFIQNLGQTLIHKIACSAWFGTLAPMNLLLKHGLDHSRPNNREQSPLHLAALQGHRACVAALLKAGADPTLGDFDNNSPLHMAVIGSHYDCVRELLNDDDVDVNVQNNQGFLLTWGQCYDHYFRQFFRGENNWRIS